MKHLLFPSKEQADAFIEDLRAQGVIQPDVGQTTVNRRGMMDTTGGMDTTGTMTDRTSDRYAGDTYAGADDTAEEAGEGAIEGTGVGAAVGAVAGAVATVATGGIAAVPVLLGMTALGSGVGAAVGAIGGAAGAEADGGYGDNYGGRYDLEGDRYDSLHSGVNEGGRAIAVDENVPEDAVRAAADRHGGRFV